MILITEFIIPDYQKHRLKIKLQAHPIYKRALRFNYAPLFMNFVESRLGNWLQNVIISIFGEPGMGKSYVGWTIGEIMTNILVKFYPNVIFDETHVYLDLAELEERLKTAQKGETFMLDEQTDFYGTGSNFVIATLGNIEMTCRKNQINLIYCAPCVRTHYHNLVLETFMSRWPIQRCTVREKGYIPEGQTLCFVYGQQSKTFFDPLGMMKVNHPKNLEALRKYELNKDEYMARVLQGDSINISGVRNKIIAKFMESEYVDRCFSKKDIRMALKILKIVPDGAPNTFLDDIAHQIIMEGKIEKHERKRTSNEEAIEKYEQHPKGTYRIKDGKLIYYTDDDGKKHYSDTEEKEEDE